MPAVFSACRPHPALPVVWLVAVAVAAAAVRAEDPVAVLITGPLAGKVGDRVAFEVELVNRSGRPLEKLRVIDYFDKGFQHDASASPIEQKGTVDLAVGTSRRLTLDFRLAEPGRQCHRVEILDQAHTFVGGATSCVEVAGVATTAPVVATPPAAAYPPTTYPGASTVPGGTSAPMPVATVPPAVPAVPLVVAPLAAATTSPSGTPALELDLVGPAEVPPDTVAEFVATVRNTGSVAAGATTLEFAWEDAFTPLEASDGYKLASSRVSWELPTLEPGSQLRRQINLRSKPATAVTTSQRSCVRAVLSGAPGGVMVADESCVLVRSTAPRPRSPREAGLRLTLADCDDPVVVGNATTLVCTVVNNGTAATGRLDVTVVLPDRATLVGDPQPARVRIDGASITFDVIPSIPPGGQATMELAYRMSSGGAGKATAILRGADLEGSLDAACQTTFLTP